MRSSQFKLRENKDAIGHPCFIRNMSGEPKYAKFKGYDKYVVIPRYSTLEFDQTYSPNNVTLYEYNQLIGTPLGEFLYPSNYHEFINNGAGKAINSIQAQKGTIQKRHGYQLTIPMGYDFAQPILDEVFPKEKRCECGALKTYGDSCTKEFHSTWCEMSK